MFKIRLSITLYFLLGVFSLYAQTSSLKAEIAKITEGKKATVGVSIYGIEDNDSVSINNNLHFPMQSVFKFHIALTVLHYIDEGKLHLDQPVFIQKKELLPNTWSPIREKYPNGNMELPLSEILRYTVAESDNNGCDILLRLVDGAKTVSDFIHKMGIDNFSIEANEEEMHKDWETQFKNWTTPTSTTTLLQLFYNRHMLSKSSFNFLWDIMLQTATGTNRIKGQLPQGAAVAHKTGSSGKNKQGVTAATNDIGIVTLPNNKHFAIAVFITDSKETEEVNEKMIADIAKLAWNYFLNKTN